MTAIAALREDEIQALIVGIELAEPVETPNNNHYRFRPRTVAEATAYFRSSAGELSAAWRDLEAMGLTSGPGDPPVLTERGRVPAREVHLLRPPIWYWYGDFYAAIDGSSAFSTYCERVFGRDLSQHGFADMPQLERLVAALDLCSNSRVLDIGCGNGKMAEHVSDSTGAHVTGVDYVPLGVAQAIHRTRPKSDRLRFITANLDTLEMSAGSFDAVSSIDSIFFGRSLEDTIRRLAAVLAPAFQREGIHFVWENLMAESIDDTTPSDPGSRAFRRSLTLVRFRHGGAVC